MKARTHWWLERLSSLALMPLSIWFVIEVSRTDLSQAVDLARWLREPVTALLLGLFMTVSLYHAKLGLEAVIDDYISSPRFNPWGHQANRFILLVSFVASIAGILHFAQN